MRPTQACSRSPRRGRRPRPSRIAFGGRRPPRLSFPWRRRRRPAQARAAAAAQPGGQQSPCGTPPPARQLPPWQRAAGRAASTTRPVPCGPRREAPRGAGHRGQ
eukprot:8156100-Alexandrium_andersonii.AAC.1